MPKPKFIFGVHCHLPVGTPEKTFEEAYLAAYLPFIELLDNQPNIKFTAHYSGALFDFFKAKHPEFLELLRRLVDRHQLELLSGGYYEPSLSLIPDQDKIGQIETLNRFLKEEFGRSPQGAWLAGGAWEPTFPKILAQAGVEYALVGDLQKHDGYYVTEEEGEKTIIFPVNSQLSAFLPFEPPAKIVDYIGHLNPELLVCFGDGEKFGWRDGSHNWIYQHGYLAKLLTELSSHVEFTTFADYLDDNEPRGVVYPAAQGSGREDLLKYPEANNMHKRMLSISKRLHGLTKSKILLGEEEKNERLKNAISSLYRSQCSDSYSSGGNYDVELRRAVYANLIGSENEMDNFSRGSRQFVELSVSDLDKDGRDEVMITNSIMSVFVAPSAGGAIFELDYRPRTVNLLNVLGRRCLVDHFLSLDSSINRIKEVGDFTNAKYLFLPKRSAGEVGVLLRQDGTVNDVPIRVEKNISIVAKQSIVNIDYLITNLGSEPAELWFCPEFNFGLSDPTLKEKGEIRGVQELKIIDEWNTVNVSLEVTQGCLLWHFPIVTISESDSGSARIYQGAALLPSWRFKLAAGASWQVRISWRIEE